MLVHTIAFFAALSFSLDAFASPITPGHGGTSISLAKRVLLTKGDGTFDHDKFRVSVLKTINKHKQNAKNRKVNCANDTSIPWKAPPPPPTQSSSPQHQASEALIDQENDSEWTGAITIGSNEQPFIIDFDTGSADLWVTNAAGCSTCAGKHVYDATSSTSCKGKSGSFSISYGDGSSVHGPIFTDPVAIAGVSVNHQTFSAVTTLSAMFDGDPADGLLGLGFQSISQLSAPPFFQTGISQGVFTEERFAFKISSDPSASSIFLGGTDTRLYTGPIEFHHITDAGAWVAPGASVLVNGKKFVSGLSTLSDSGTSIILGPPDVVKQLFASIKGSKPFSQEQQFALYTYPCASATPEIAFSWGGRTWSISADDFNLGLTELGSSDCVGGIGGADIPAQYGDNVWVLGDTFMKNVYSVFDVGQKAVGFAQLK